MGKFKAPFSSQKSQDCDITSIALPAHRKHPGPVARNKPKPSPIHIGRVNIITPRTKHKIKKRFAESLAQEQCGIKATSPGFLLPFDLSQSQSRWSQQSEPALEEAVVNNEADTTCDNQNTCDTASDVVAIQAYNAEDIPAEFYIEFDEEFDEETEQGETVTEEVTANTVEANTIEIAAEDMYGYNDVTNSTEDSNSFNIKRRQVKTKNPPKNRKETQARQDHEANVASEHDFDMYQAIISKPSPLATGTRKYIRKRDYRLMMKEEVLQTIYKMHKEIEALQKRRAELVQGNGKFDTNSWNKKQVAFRGTLLEE